MQKIISLFSIVIMMLTFVFPFSAFAQSTVMQNNASIDLVSPTTNSRTVSLDDDKKTIVSSEAEVNTLQKDQTITSSDASVVLDVSTFFKDANFSKDTAHEEIKKNIEKEIQQALNTLDTQLSTSEDTRSFIIEKKAELFTNIDSYFEQDSAITNPDTVSELNISINAIFKKIEEKLAQDELQNKGVNSGEEEPFTFERVTLTETLFAYQKAIEERTQLFENRNQQVFRDSDNDGLSDFDEIFIYKTDPNKAYTVEGKLNDREKIIAGVDPLSVIGEKIVYEDPRLDRDAVEVLTYSLLGVSFVPASESLDGKEDLVLSGVALPNSLTTIYIFSAPRVITVETDSEGKWSYTLGKELENGEHTVFVTTTDNKGRLLAKSAPTILTKTSQTAVIGVLATEGSARELDPLLNDYAFAVLMFLLVIGMVVTFILIISSRKGKEEEKEESSYIGRTHPEDNSFTVAEVTPQMRNETLYPHIDKKG
jgi:6-pyruvoyl-tetrahydropterin synthase